VSVGVWGYIILIYHKYQEKCSLLLSIQPPEETQHGSTLKIDDTLKKFLIILAG
jgi:hypothetical protein